MKGTVLALVRHGAAIVAAWLAGYIALTPEQVSDVEQGLTIAGAAIMLAVYALGEKALKPLFYRLFGEVQPGEVPPATHDVAKAREGV